MKEDDRVNKPLPFDEETERYLFDDSFSVVSTTEFTGLMPTPAETNDAVSSYSEIYNVSLSRDDAGKEPKNANTTNIHKKNKVKGT